MKQRIKQANKRKKALFGIDDALIMAGIGLASSIGGAAFNASQQRKAAKEQRHLQTLMGNVDNAFQATANEDQAYNATQQNNLETAKTNVIPTINNFKCGGRKRMKRGGSTVVGSIVKNNKYI